jgi:hypothetical protein
MFHEDVSSNKQKKTFFREKFYGILLLVIKNILIFALEFNC